MWICLPVLSFIFLILFYRNKFPSLGWRVGFILSAVTLSFCAVIFVEILSLFSILKASIVFLFWVIIFLLSLWAAWRSSSKNLLKLIKVPALGILEIVVLSGIVLIILMNALIAFSFPPNNWDSMTYHLPRIMHWAAHASVRFYPTSIGRQLFYTPGAEFSLLHCFLLTGDDRWFNFLQWVSFIGCILGASLIAQNLGASKRGQFLTALFVATIPMAILQSTSTQNDLYVSFWIIAFVALMLTLQKKFLRVVFWAAAASLGLGLLAKGTFLMVLPFLVCFFISKGKKSFKYIFISLSLVLVLVAGHNFRSWAWQKVSTSANNLPSGVMMKRHDPASVAVNGISHIASEMMLPIKKYNLTVEKFVQKGAIALGVDTNSSEMFGQLFTSPTSIYSILVFDEDLASNPFHLMLIAAVLFWVWRLRSKKDIGAYALCVFVSGFLFVFLAAWSPYSNRLHLPLFILFSPLVGKMIDSWWKWSVKLFILILFVIAGLTICLHQTRPLVQVNNPYIYPRDVFYFMKKPKEYDSYNLAAHTINSSRCQDVGLMEDSDSWEYPLWAMTGFGKVQFRDLDIKENGGVLPCMIVTLEDEQDKSIVLKNKTYNLVWQEYPLQIFTQTR